ncbi:MAG TPA: hypothetical protein VFV19_18710 [Candidatus Polarisedimenticolaceae bacterium]|nr:hypothetical protein [Candidatus Polarisedimenticolaceae bacterium]
MADQNVELFVHAQGAKPTVATGSAAETLRTVLVRAGVITGEGGEVYVFVGECGEALTELEDVEDGVDKHDPADVNLTLEELDLRRHRHVHVHKCRHVAVEVHFSGQTKRHRFSPATTIAVVTTWARRKLHLDPAAAAEYVLQLCNSTERPRADRHLGELVQAAVCSICFNLVREVTPQG